MSDTKTIYRTIASRVRELRSDRGLAIEDLAYKAGIAASYLGQIERLERKPSVKTIASLADALRVSPGMVFDHQGKNHGPNDSWNNRVNAMVSGMTAEHRALILKTLRFICRHVRETAKRSKTKRA